MFLSRVYQRWLECLHDLARACDMSDEEAESDMNESQRLIIKTCMDRRESEWNINSVRLPINQQQWFFIS